MNIAVVYASQYGVSEHYARLIAGRLGCDRYKAEDFPGKEADLLIYGAGVYASRVKGLKQFAQNNSRLFRKEWILFTTGLSSPDDSESMKRIRDGVADVLPPEYLSRMKHFHFPGAVDYSKLSFVHKLMLSALTKLLSKKPETEKTEMEKKIALLKGKPINLIDEEAIEVLIAHVLGNEMEPEHPLHHEEIRNPHAEAEAKAESERDLEVEAICDEEP